MPRRPSMAPFTRRATASTTSFSRRAARALDAVVVASVTRIDHDRADGRPGRPPNTGRLAAAAHGWSLSGRGRHGRMNPRAAATRSTTS